MINADLVAALERERLGETPRCRHCGKVPPKVLDQTWVEWEAMMFCDKACRSAKYLTRDDLIAEVETLAGTDHPDNIARRLGFRDREAIMLRLRNAGRDDLARMFLRQDQRHTA